MQTQATGSTLPAMKQPEHSQGREPVRVMSQFDGNTTYNPTGAKNVVTAPDECQGEGKEPCAEPWE